MVKHARLTRNQKVDIINAYSDDLTPMITLASQYGVSRQAIYKILKKASIDTKKQRLPVSCTTCGVEVLRTKARIRRQLNHFCSEGCYYAFLEAGNGFPYIQNRAGQKRARAIVSQYFNLQAGHVVHHESRNTLDNRLVNLCVFANNGDHVRHHRGFDTQPVWDGRNP